MMEKAAIPFLAVKDQLNTAGIRTTCGTHNLVGYTTWRFIAYEGEIEEDREK